MVTEVSGPPDIKGHLDGADAVVDALPWNVGHTEAQAKRARGRASALAHQIAALLAGGWTQDEVRDALDAAPAAADAPDAAAQERLWRGALKRAKHARQAAAG
jgi:hypothetical protein